MVKLIIKLRSWCSGIMAKNNNIHVKLLNVFILFYYFQIQIPIRRRHSGPPSPTRIIPISPAKPSPKSPPKAPPKPAPKPGTDSSMAYTSGFKPTKITLNKYGGGGMDFGYSPKTPPAHAAPAAHAYHPPSPPRQQYQPSPPQPSFMPQAQGKMNMSLL